MCRARRGGDDDDGVVGGGVGIVSGREILPANVKPLHYDLTLEPDFEKFTYRGTVLIEYVFLRKKLGTGDAIVLSLFSPLYFFTFRVSSGFQFCEWSTAPVNLDLYR
jgi:hypothetical protein